MKNILRYTLTTLLVLLTALPAYAADKITYYHNDALGSPVAATNQLGQTIWRETYKPHGQRTTNATASTNNKVWFTGKQEESALGINYFGARWYHPEIGRFLVIDPAGVAPESIHSFNRYAYANNNPYSNVDPDGRSPLAIELGYGGAAGGTLVCGPMCGVAGGVIGAGIGLWGTSEIIKHLSENQSDADNGSSGGDDGKSRNKPPEPLPEAEGRPHSIIENPGKDGQYTTHNGDGTWKQYRGAGKDHGDIPRPNVKEAGKNVTPNGDVFIDRGRVRPPKPGETPGG